MTYKEIFLDLAESYLPMSHERHHVCDHWCEAMDLAFDVASVADQRGLTNIMDYQCGAFGHDPIEDQYRLDVLSRLSDDQLSGFYAYVSRVVNMLKKHGKNY